MNDNGNDKTYKSFEAQEEIAKDLTDWENAPTLRELQADYESAKVDHTAHTVQVDAWINILNGKQNLKTKKGRSKIVPKVARKQAEWRYSSLAEPFLSTDDLFQTSPVTFEDTKTATQNGLVLNYQFNNKLDKTSFIDEYIRTAVDEGTVIVRTGWEYEEATRTVHKDITETRTVLDPNTGQPTVQEIVVGTEKVEETVVVKNQPTLDICDYNNIIIDPTCSGKFSDAKFAIWSFETSLSELKKDGRYKNLDNINIESSSILNTPDHELAGEDRNFKFKDDPRKRIIAHEYWGYWDINDTGEVEPFVATWVGDTLIRMEENPYPDKKLPFVSVQYLLKRKATYGEPDAALLEDNQRIIGAVTRGIIDVIGRSANGQLGIRKDALDVVNSRKYDRGEDYQFNAAVDPNQAFHMGKYPEIPRSAMEVIAMQNNEAESLTGVKAFSSGISGQALGVSATGIRSALDATSKRELGILRRLANGLTQIGRKIISMNSEWLEDTEIIRITNEEFVEIDRNDLGGEYDIKLKIATAEADEQKASELSFMLQTMGNNLPLELSQIVLADIATLRKMPELSKRISDYQAQPDPLAQEKAMLELELLKAKIVNEQAKGQENAVDVGLKQAKTATEQAKARSLHSGSDQTDLDFLNKESGVLDANKEQQMELSHKQDMEKREHDRLSKLDQEAFKQMQSKNSNA
ncbi:MAG: chromosome partitioning protein ParB [Nanoarchaeota archaeon]|nr:chromosome partitioning protein ParB [Nanoarchaeota archaeon]